MPAKRVSWRRLRATDGAAGSSAGRTARRGLVEVRELAEERKACLDFAGFELLQAFCSEALDGKRSHDAAVEHSLAEDGGGESGLRGDIAEESAGKGVACTGGIDDFGERQR